MQLQSLLLFEYYQYIAFLCTLICVGMVFIFLDVILQWLFCNGCTV